MVLAQTANGILLPVILIYTVRLSSDRELMAERANGPVYKAFTRACAVGSGSPSSCSSPY
jgi:Mn2+/Fe2+ NRAMP family transporter